MKYFSAAGAYMELTEDQKKAKVLMDLCDDHESSPFLANERCPHYNEIIKYLSRYMKLTRKDLKNIVDFEKLRDTSICLEEGHLTERFVLENSNNTEYDGLLDYENTHELLIYKVTLTFLCT